MSSSVDRGTGPPLAPRRAPRLFAARVDEPRSRRASDVLLLAAATLALGLAGVAATPPAGVERTVLSFVAGLPSGLGGLWWLFIDGFTLAAVGLMVAAVARRRWALVRDLVLAGLLAVALAVVTARLVGGSWPPLGSSLRNNTPSLWFPALRMAVTAAVVLAGSPHLTKPARRVGRWLVAFGAFSVALLGLDTPTAVVGGLLIAVMAAAIIHLVFGSSRGRPSLADVARALDGLGVSSRSLGVADRQRTGLFLVDAEDDEGNRLVVKVYGRDAADTQLLTTAWRTLWYREPGSPLVPGRRHQAEHEAFLTLLAGQAGIVTQRVVTAGATATDDVLIVLQPVGTPLDTVPDRWSAALVERLWAMLDRLHQLGIAHGEIDDRHLVVEDDEVGIVDFRGATLAPTDQQLLTDRAQALVTSGLALGFDEALALALAALGPDGLAAVLPFVQPTALTARQRALVGQAGVSLDDVRRQAAAGAGVEAPELQELRRVTWRSVLQPVLLVVAFLALARGLAGIDFEDLQSQLGDALWWFVVVGAVVAQMPRVAQAVSLLGASPSPVPLGPLYALQLASSYLSLAVPTSAARIAINIRFFQRHGLATGSALAVGALDGVSGFIVQVVLLVGIVVLTPASLELDFDGAAPTGLVRLVAVVVLAGLVALGALLVVSTWRRRLFGWLRQLATEALIAARGLRSPRRAGMLFGGNLASEVLFAAALGAFVAALGYPVNLTELILINVSVSLLAGVLPIPGGIGVVEGGLTFGLVRAGVPEDTAFAAVLMYRLATFYLPPIWGFFALGWLERNKHL